MDMERLNSLEGIPFSFEKELGKGKFGAVFEGENRETGERRALKVVKKSSRVGKSETNVMHALPQHPNVIHMESCFDITENLCVFVLELCHTDLRTWIQERGGKLEEEEARTLMRGIIQGLQALSEKNIFHRDLKPENILLSFSEDGETITPKLADFGLARLLNRPGEVFQTFTGFDFFFFFFFPFFFFFLFSFSFFFLFSSSFQSFLYLTPPRNSHSSPLYFAPEIWASKGYTTKSDIYSCGVLLWEMLTGDPPFSFSRNKLQLRRLCLFSGIPEEDFEGLGVGEEGRVLLRRMLERDCEVRIDWEELFCYPWLFK